MKNLLFLLLFLAQTVSAQFTNINILKEVKAKEKGLVVSAHPLASEAGAQILKKVEMPLTLRLLRNLLWQLFIHKLEILVVVDFW